MTLYWIRALVLVCACLFLFAVPVQAEWIYDGNAICAADDIQQEIEMISDGAGGAIMVWEDRRVDHDIYAQRIDGDGNPLWTPGGHPICIASGNQRFPKIITDGGDGAIIAWTDTRSGYAIYAQRVDAVGDTLWDADGVIVTHDPSYAKGDVDITADGMGGAFLAWQDGSGAGTFPIDIWAHHIDSDGDAVWPLHGVAICQAWWNQVDPKIVPSDNESAIICWIDTRDNLSHIYGQRVDKNGTIEWATDGIALTDTVSWKSFLCMVTDGADGGIMVWSDNRDHTNIFGQRIDPTGTTLWAPNGVPVCEAPSVQNTIDLMPMAGGAIATWEDNRSPGYGVYASMITSTGARPWTTDGVLVSNITSNFGDPRLTTDGAGGAIIAWHEFRNASGSYDVLAQHLDSNGVPMWASGGVPVSTADSQQQYPLVASDGAGGALIAWRDGRDYASSDYDIYGGTVDHTGWNRVPTFLAGFWTHVDRDVVTIEWALAEPAEGAVFHVLRGVANGVFREIDRMHATGSEMTFVFSDERCAPGETYRYRIDVTDQDGRTILFETASIAVPEAATILEQNTPNPFNPSTTIRFYLAERVHVHLGVFDARGKRVAQLIDETRPAGWQSVDWNASGATNAPLTSGVYFYRLTVGKTELTRKMTLLR